MPRKTNPALMNPAAQAGDTDGVLAYYASQRGACRDYTDDFVRRTELSEADRPAYKAAWYAAHARVKATFQL